MDPFLLINGNISPINGRKNLGKWSYFTLRITGFWGHFVGSSRPFWGDFATQEPSVARTTCPRPDQHDRSSDGRFQMRTITNLISWLCGNCGSTFWWFDVVFFFCFWTDEECILFQGGGFKYLFQIQLFFEEMTDMFQMGWNHDIVWIEWHTSRFYYVDMSESCLSRPNLFLEVSLNGKLVSVSWT